MERFAAPPAVQVVVIDEMRFIGAVVASDGRELPITDHMVRRACDALADDRFPFSTPPPRRH